MTFLSHNSDYFGIVSLHCAIQTLSELWDTVNSQLQEKKSEFWDKVTSTLFPLYSMAEISFHGFHMCKGKKQTNKHKNAQSNTHSHSSPLPLIQLLLSLLQLFLSLSQTLFLCCSASTKPIQRGLFYSVVDVMEIASTPDYSSNWDWNQLFLNISVICYLWVLISCYNTLYREDFSIRLSCCCSRGRSFILYLRFGTLGLQFWHAVFKHL